MIIKDGYEIHSLRQSKITIGEDVIYELNSKHNRSWFILDLALSGSVFITADSKNLVTSDGLTFCTHSRRTNV